jgi:hypothetical protein
MSLSHLSFIRWCAEFRPKETLAKVPIKTRGIYALLKHYPKTNKFDVVYIGMARGSGVKARLWTHARSKRKGTLWTHFSVFAVWPNVSDDQVAELEGLFRHIYRQDSRANQLAISKEVQEIVFGSQKQVQPRRPAVNHLPYPAPSGR